NPCGRRILFRSGVNRLRSSLLCRVALRPRRAHSFLRVPLSLFVSLSGEHAHRLHDWPDWPAPKPQAGGGQRALPVPTVRLAAWKTNKGAAGERAFVRRARRRGEVRASPPTHRSLALSSRCSSFSVFVSCSVAAY